MDRQISLLTAAASSLSSRSGQKVVLGKSFGCHCSMHCILIGVVGGTAQINSKDKRQQHKNVSTVHNRKGFS